MAKAVGRPESIFNEVGLTGLRHFRGILDDEFLHVLKGKEGIAVYKEMANNDPVIGGVLHATIQMMRKVPTSILTMGTSQKELEAREFVAQCFNDMNVSWQDTQTDIFSMLIYGWSYFEKIFKVRKGYSRNPKTQSRYDDGKIGFRKFAIRAQDTLDHWEIDESGGIHGMWQDAIDGNSGIGKLRFISIDRSLLFRTLLNKNNPEGKSLLRSCYRPFFYKNNFEELVAIGVERDLVGLPIMVPPDGFNTANKTNEDLANGVKRVLRNVRRDQQEGVLVPPGWEFKLLSSPGQRQFDMESLLNYYDKRIAISLLGQFVLLGMERVGSFALATQQSDLFALSMQGWLGSIDEVVNRFAIDALLRLNNYENLENPPYLAHGRIQEHSLDELSVFITRISKAGFLTPDAETENLLRLIAGLTEIPDRPSIVREAGRREISHTPVESRKPQRVNGKKIIDTTGENDRSADVEEKASGYFVYVENSIKWESESIVACFDKLQTLKQKYKTEVIGISRKLGNGHDGLLCEDVIRYVPMRTFTNHNGDENFKDWLKTRVGVLSEV